MPSFSQHYRRRPIAWRLLAVILALSVLFTLLETGIQLFTDYKREVGAVRSTISQIEQSQVNSLAQSVWDLDYGQIKATLDGLSQVPAVQHISVTSNTGDRFVRGVPSESEDDSVISRVFDLTHKGQTIGKLELQMSLQETYQQLRERALLTLLTEGGKTFVLSLVILGVIGKLITRHLAKLSDQARNKQLSEPFTLDKNTSQTQPDELDNLVGALNSMQESLQAELARRTEAEEALLAHQKDLEAQVDARTKKLSYVNQRLSERLEFEHVVAELSTKFINLPSSDVDDAINEALRSIGEYSRIDRAFIWLFDHQGQRARQPYLWNSAAVDEYVTPEEGLPIAGFPWIGPQILSGQEVNIRDIEELDEDMVPEKPLLINQIGIRSLSIIPLSLGSEVMGMLGFSTVGRSHNWREDEWVLLRLTGNMLINAIQNKQSRERLQHLSQVDGLTGLANRRFFNEVLDREVRRACRINAPLSVVMCDIDHFKRYNDYYGHVAGDGCLKQVASTIHDMFRRASDLCARYGGEEFVVLVRGGEDHRVVLERANALRAQIASLELPHAGIGEGSTVSLSIGVTTMFVSDEGDGLTLLDTADKALYCAKNHGRDRVVSYDQVQGFETDLAGK